jgi:DNA-binding NarL/FixJ family response regulator
MDEKLKVLIVDDSVTTRALLLDTLAGLNGVRVVGGAGDGEEGLKLAATLKPDVLTLDLRMPHGGGIEFIPRFKQLNPTPIVMVLTNFPFSSYRRRCEDAGADHFFDKSEELHLMVELLRDLTARRAEEVGHYE